MTRIQSIDDLPEYLREQAREQLREWEKHNPLPTITWSEPFEVIPTERDEQAALFAWADGTGGGEVSDRVELTSLLYANVNGQYRQGQRPEPGLKPGVPDVFLPVAGNGKHGLYIELKRRKGAVVSDAQKEWLRVLEGQGYAVSLSYGAAEAIAVIKDYLFAGGE